MKPINEQKRTNGNRAVSALGALFGTASTVITWLTTVLVIGFWTWQWLKSTGTC